MPLFRLNDLKFVLKLIFGSVLVSLVPRSSEHRVFKRISALRLRRLRRHVDVQHDLDARTISQVLGDRLRPGDVEQIIASNHELNLEDEWTRWRSSLSADSNVETEVEGLHYAQEALANRRGIVFWGLSFCENMFPKIALANAGIPLTQLSNLQHGSGHPMTKFNLAVNARLYCSQENRYLADRIVIPADNNPSYLKAIGRLLKSNGCVWMSAERGQADNPFTIDLLGTEATLPKGAPVLAMRHRAALLPAYTTRMGPFRYRLTIAKPIEFDKTLPRALTLEKAANELAVLLSEQILEQPENWCWESSWLRKVTLGDDTAREDEDQITYSGIRRLFGRGRVAKH